MTVQILIGDCRDLMATLPDESVHTVVTSPPYWGLRDYGVEGQLGLEKYLGEHVEIMVGVFREVRRVLRHDGTLWLNYGDSYATSINGRSAADTKAIGNDDRTFRDKPFSTIGPIFRPDNPEKNGGRSNRDGLRVDASSGLKPKDLCGIPWRVAFALQADGWWLRQDIIWSKPNPMPESVRDRCTKAHEYLFLLSKSERYYYDAAAIAEPSISKGYDDADLKSNVPGWSGNPNVHGEKGHALPGAWSNGGNRNRRSVWEIATQPFPESHFATMPAALVEPCIKAGCPEKVCAKCGAPRVRVVERSGGTTGKSWHDHSKDIEAGQSQSIDVRAASAGYKIIDHGFVPSCSCNASTVPGTVLDCFGGAGTTGLVADRLQRNAVLIELNPTYAAMARCRIDNDAPLFSEYNATDDFAKSIDLAYETIRQRKAAGGPGWEPR